MHKVAQHEILCVRGEGFVAGHSVGVGLSKTRDDVERRGLLCENR